MLVWQAPYLVAISPGISEAAVVYCYVLWFIVHIDICDNISSGLTGESRNGYVAKLLAIHGCH